MPAVPAKANYKTDYRWVDLEQISPHAAVAVIAAEDQFFPFHIGFDFKSIRDAIRSNEAQAKRRRPRVRGASTITQQVAKNLFLWPGRSYLRKGLEVYFTLLIELSWPKERILEVYLNVAQFGAGIYGVEAAARRFYAMPAARLGRYESATLAAVLPNPITFKVQAPSNYVVEAPRLDPRADARARRAALPRRARRIRQLPKAAGRQEEVRAGGRARAKHAGAASESAKFTPDTRSGSFPSATSTSAGFTRRDEHLVDRYRVADSFATKACTSRRRFSAVVWRDRAGLR